MNPETPSPIPLLPHEAVHAAACPRGMLWRAIDPQPILGCEDENGPYYQHPICRESVFGPLTFADREYPQAAYQPALYFVQGEYADNPHFGSGGQPRRFYRNDDPAAYDTDADWSTTDAESARTIIEVTQVEAKQADRLTHNDIERLGGSACETWAWFLGNYSGRADTWGFLYHYTVKERRS